MDHAGLSARAAADLLGHANTPMTTDVYFARKVAATGAAAALEALGYESRPATRCWYSLPARRPISEND